VVVTKYLGPHGTHSHLIVVCMAGPGERDFTGGVDGFLKKWMHPTHIQMILRQQDDLLNHPRSPCL